MLFVGFTEHAFSITAVGRGAVERGPAARHPGAPARMQAH